MIAARFRPVGKGFPVFLHPTTGEKYALARTERKSAPGYHDFAVHASPGLSYEEELARRDLTTNAMARDADGRLVDPCGGASALAGKAVPGHRSCPARGRTAPSGRAWTEAPGPTQTCPQAMPAWPARARHRPTGPRSTQGNSGSGRRAAKGRRVAGAVAL